MPPFYSEAAQLLLSLTRLGLKIDPALDARVVVHRLATLIHHYLTKNSSLSHAGAAQWILADICSHDSVHVEGKRARLVAIIGTVIGNIQTGRHKNV